MMLTLLFYLVLVFIALVAYGFIVMVLYAYTEMACIEAYLWPVIGPVNIGIVLAERVIARLDP